MRVLCRAVALGIAIVATMAPAANAARSTDFDADWRFALVNREAATDPTGAFDGAAEPGFDDSSWRALDLPHDWSIELLPTATGRHDGRHRVLPGRARLVPQDVHAPALGARQADLRRVRRRLHGLRGLLQRPPGREPSVRLHGVRRRAERRPHRRPHPNVLAVKVRNQVPSSRWYPGSGIYRHVHLVGHEPRPRRAPRRVRHDARPRATSTPAAARACTSRPTSPAAARASSRSCAIRGAGSSARADAAHCRRAGDVVGGPRLWSVEHPHLYTLQTG